MAAGINLLMVVVDQIVEKVKPGGWAMFSVYGQIAGDLVTLTKVVHKSSSSEQRLRFVYDE